MNEKIKEFAKQAWPGLPSHWWDSQDGAEAVEKFAKLIAKESAKFMDEYADRTGRDLLEHFGVEE